MVIFFFPHSLEASCIYVTFLKEMAPAIYKDYLLLLKPERCSNSVSQTVGCTGKPISRACFPHIAFSPFPRTSIPKPKQLWKLSHAQLSGRFQQRSCSAPNLSSNLLDKYIVYEKYPYSGLLLPVPGSQSWQIHREHKWQ